MKSTIFALVLAGVLAVAASQQCIGSTSTFITAENNTLSPYFPALVNGTKQANFTGTVFYPTNDAVDALLGAILDAANLSRLPSSVTPLDLFSLPAVVDILQAHVVPGVVVRPENVTVAAGQTVPAGPFKTLLSDDTAQTFCKTRAAFNISANVTKSTAGNLSVVVGLIGDSVPVVRSQATCDGIVHFVSRVLLPCSLPTSNLAELVVLLQAAAKATASPIMGMSSPAARGMSPVMGMSSPAPPNAASSAALSFVALVACTFTVLAGVVGL